jgi:carotenoid cleavage dioxygenase-like enzyme
MTQSNYYNSTVDGERPLLRSFGGITPPLTPAEKAKTLATVSVADNYNVNVVKVGSKTFTISDTVGQVEIDADTLDTVGGFEYADDLEALTSIISCAHPTQLPGDKYFYNYQTALFGNLPHIGEVHKLQFYRVDTTKEPLSREVMIEIPMKDLSYLHQFANTPNYLVLLHYPLFWQVMGIATGTEILPHMKWDASKGTRVQVIDKRTWTITREYTTDATFAYHHLNAYEDGDNVIVDILTNICDDSTGDASCDDMNKFQLETLKDNSFFIKGSPLRRFTVPVTGDGDISWYDINNRGMGLHAVHPLMKGQKHRYAWALDNKGPGVWWNALVKIDMEKDDSASLQWYKEDHYPSEVSFIPRPGATEEDDGVLVSIVLGNDGAVKTSYMLVLDAKDMSVIATVPAPVHLPFPSHGHTCAPIETSPGVMENMCFWA